VPLMLRSDDGGVFTGLTRLHGRLLGTEQVIVACGGGRSEVKSKSQSTISLPLALFRFPTALLPLQQSDQPRQGLRSGTSACSVPAASCASVLKKSSVCSQSDPFIVVSILNGTRWEELGR
jgi:hypothetical protein